LFREPDLVFVTEQRKQQNGDRFYEGADLVVEIVSSGAKAHERDYEQKVADYAAAGIGEYWIVDPHEQRITVLALQGANYVPLGEFAPGQTATSKLLSGFAVDVTEVFAAQK
jgi:Uma2 family endonuclease